MIIMGAPELCWTVAVQEQDAVHCCKKISKKIQKEKSVWAFISFRGFSPRFAGSIDFSPEMGAETSRQKEEKLPSLWQLVSKEKVTGAGKTV